MSTLTQANLERQLEKRWTQVKSGKMTPKKAFGTIEEWSIELGDRKAFLHPNLKQWMWYDRLHDEWVYAGCGIEEAILITIDKLGGVKKLPQPEIIDNWCVYKQGQELHGPLCIEELRKQLESKQIPKTILVWSTQATDWLKVTSKKGKEIIFADNAKGN